MKYQILCIGKLKDQFYKDAISDLCNQIKKQKREIEIIEFPDEKIPEHLKGKRKELFLEKECERLINKISKRDYVVALCIEGKEMTTNQHKKYIVKAMEAGYDSIVYVIGGSLGLPERVKERANLKLSFSKMTFPHQMMRMILCEEIANMINVTNRSNAKVDDLREHQRASL